MLPEWFWIGTTIFFAFNTWFAYRGWGRALKGWIKALDGWADAEERAKRNA